MLIPWLGSTKTKSSQGSEMGKKLHNILLTHKVCPHYIHELKHQNIRHSNIVSIIIYLMTITKLLMLLLLLLLLLLLFYDARIQ